MAEVLQIKGTEYERAPWHWNTDGKFDFEETPEQSARREDYYAELDAYDTERSADFCAPSSS